jgi:MarR family transcriptional regulator, transcriptional regulator for hemolysin
MSDLPESPVGERFSAAVHNTARGWRLLIDKQLKHLGIGQAGWMTIAMIAKSGEPMSQRALADLVGVEGPSMVSMLDRLEREGLVTRAPSPTDRRVKLVHLTEAGTTLYQQVREQANAVRAALLGDIAPDKLAAATELLELLRARIEEQL